MLTLSARMRAVADMVPAGQPVTDVGTDHAYIPIALIEEGRIPSACASDIGEGPLGRAKANIAGHHLTGRIRTVLCDGVPPGEIEGTLILAGMGGILMSRILRNAAERLQKVTVIVGEPQSDPDNYRRTLCELGYRITDEVFLKEDGKYYAVIRSDRATGAEEALGLTEAELLYGPVLIRKGDPLFLTYLEEQAAVRAAIGRRLDESGLPKDHPRRLTLSREIRLIEEAFKGCVNEETD